ncbi:unnamed protein product [Lymnaea stagnalis]|uniref:E3 ubiquitin-protein ligase PPP1R11 n=1 Tax=Lymnaea stagnalis TaxID=6523 RepID=A0AAV2HXV6_LYMST
MAESTSLRLDEETGSQTVLLDKEETSVGESPPVLQLRLQQPKTEPKVKWSTDTIDNEFMGKKKSKCCCIYEKPKVFGESESSSSDEEDEGCTPHCRGHKKKCYRHRPHGQEPNKNPNDHNDHDCDGPSRNPENDGTDVSVNQV